MKVLSLYCGGGGIDEGLKHAGLKTTLAIDIDKDMIETIKLNHPDCETIVGKVGDYVESLKGFDVIVGGPPCPEFSRANAERTFDMCEVNNFWKVIEYNKPYCFLMENVEDVALKLYKTNYFINSADYGVPQIRWRRYFTNLPRPSQSHSESPQNNLFGKTTKKWISIREALGFDDINGYVEDRKMVFGEKYRTYSLDRPCFTILTDCRIWLLEDLKNKNPEIYRRHKANDINRPCSTIDTGHFRPNEFITDGKYARKLSNFECQILMGFPKDYKFAGGKTKVRRQIGNAVTPPVITAFFKGVKIHGT